MMSTKEVSRGWRNGQRRKESLDLALLLVFLLYLVRSVGQIKEKSLSRLQDNKKEKRERSETIDAEAKPISSSFLPKRLFGRIQVRSL